MLEQKKSATWRQIVEKERAIAVIRSPQLSLGLAMAKAVADGGIKIIEITWNSEQPAELISKLRNQFPTHIIGAGTILNLTDLQGAISSGAQFIFSPHVNLQLIQAANAAHIPIVPGALTPTEIMTAWQAGATCVKVFPISAMGGVNYLKSLQGPLGNIPLIPTGGVTIANAREFIEAGACAVGLAGELFPQKIITAGNWQAIAQNAANLKRRLFNNSLTTHSHCHSD
ncbi:MAG: bifunctional 4-hydroxy-2-oxoglutarate aldolase/2-dehydro-3-deoxy-phosphogluconate aldolase [Gomphosphaeria aponina SAG 52.96 = DSM 107014]|uniref:Bifunctional 4-hydroxy-2-oxoglutarate aldolase/2-dehydro-3-deoxy-phosphogluconate aldolase n=1 Tax=Gomphosphaeria aponina SAG 52.96 = DSM 107014 TaxID=1521640 RepID=A0A941JQA1_9CHRO|nr:bifunctional 4-hydroxy-2-oxoglutarate aldolase/2-dehydro-3-deoxy-phosphogluconate aldolase [Gomphosphaeria aponina SAG 52.96 = DSM 107014]